MQNLDNWPARSVEPRVSPLLPGEILVAKKEIPWTAIAIIAVAALFFFKDKLPFKPSPEPAPAPAPVDPVQPDAAINQELYTVLAGKDVAALKAAEALYKAMAEIVPRLTPESITTGTLSAWMQDADMHRYWKTNYGGSLPGLSTQVNKLFIEQLGTDDRALTAVDIENVSKLLKTIAATCAKASGGKL